MSINSFSVLVAVSLLLIMLGILQFVRLHNTRLNDSISVVQRAILLVFSYWFICLADVRFLIVIINIYSNCLCYRAITGSRTNKKRYAGSRCCYFGYYAGVF